MPVFVDCELDTYQIDVDAIERNLSPRTKALLVPDLVGGMPDWDRLRAIADRHGLVLIEDSCDTLGGTFRGRPAGERAHLSLTSFSPHHIITAMGTGGMVCVDDPKHWDRAEEWVPGRWASGGVERDPMGSGYFWPFGRGVRTCAGADFAMFYMRLALAVILSMAEVRIDPGTQYKTQYYFAVQYPEKVKSVVSKLGG